MKHIFLLLLVLSNCTFISAQNSEDTWILGGAIGFDRSHNTSLSINSPEIQSSDNVFTFRPYLAKSINDRWSIGLASDYLLAINNSDLLEDNKTGRIESQSASFGVFARYNLSKADKNLGFRLEPFFYMKLGRSAIQERDVEISRVNSTAYGLNVRPIITYKISPSISLIGRLSAIGYETGTWKIQQQSITKGFSSFTGTFDVTNTQIGIEFIL
ncbi:MAG: hypothetical protein IPL46_30570 [Saprospiraceae bacterium]|nr:hypothetical protein [Saprospiraceae bacterium]